MAEFFAIFGGIGITTAAIFGFFYGHDKGYSVGYAEGVAAMREHITVLASSIQAELETIKAFEGSELITKILSRLKRSI